MSEHRPADPDAPSGDLPAQPAPFFTIEAVNPTPEEIAVLTLVLAAATSGGEEAPAPKPVSGWASPARRMRGIGRPGPGSWRAEYQPR